MVEAEKQISSHMWEQQPGDNRFTCETEAQSCFLLVFNFVQELNKMEEKLIVMVDRFPVRSDII